MRKTDIERPTGILPASRIESVNEYYFSQKLQQISVMRSEGVDVINLGIGSPDLPPAPEVIAALQTSALIPEHHGYQSYRGTDALRKAYSDWYKHNFEVDLNPSNEIIPLMGSKEGIMHISMAFLNPGDKVLIPDPGYPTYAAAARLTGAEPVFYDLNEDTGWIPDLFQIEKNGLNGVKMMWVNYPQMPSGAVCNKDFFERLIAFGKLHNILICNDNPYAFILNDHPMSLLSVNGSKEIAIELNSLSKSHNMAGWRMGMAATNAVFANHILKVKSNMDSGMFKPLQDAAVIALSLGSDWYKSVNKIYEQRRNIVWEIFDVLNCSICRNQAGLFVWAKIPDDYIDAEALSEMILMESGVFFTPGHVFGDNGKMYLRSSLCAPESRIKEALQRLKNINFKS
jgi:LL-diaminopimelate aminotransferase